MRKTLIALATLALSAAPAFAQEAKVAIGISGWTGFAPLTLAKEAGLFKKHGLDVELIEFSSGTDLIKAIVGGQLDTGVLGFTNAVAWASKGADLKVVGGAQQGYHSILVREDTDIQDVAGLKDRTLASQREGSTADAGPSPFTFHPAPPRGMELS